VTLAEFGYLERMMKTLKKSEDIWQKRSIIMLAGGLGPVNG
jgi:hypothetical protein